MTGPAGFILGSYIPLGTSDRSNSSPDKSRSWTICMISLSFLMSSLSSTCNKDEGNL